MKLSIELRARIFNWVAIVCVAFPAAATAAQITWTNTAGGNWSVAANWSPQQVPTAADDVTLISAEYTLTVDVPASANSLSMDTGSPTLAGPGPVTLGGSLSWSSGTITTVVYCNGGTVNDPAGLNGGQLINSGTLTWLPYPYTGNGSVISNASTGVINIQLSGAITGNHYGGSSFFYNAGQINASGAGDGTVGDTFINTGTVTVTNGTLEAAAGGTNFGTMIVEGTGIIGVNGDFYFTDTSVLSGSGEFMVAGGTANIGGKLNITGNWTVIGGTANFNGTTTSTGQEVTVSGGVANFVGVGPWNPEVLNFSGSTLAGPAPIVVSGPLNWTAGIITTVIYCNGGTVNNPSGLNGGQLINSGTMSWIPYPYTGNGSVISNSSTGVMNIQLDRPITANHYGGPSYFYNAGVINGSGTDVGTIGDTFINTGTVDITSGAFQAAAGGTNFGTITAEGTGLVGVAGGTFYFADSSVLSGSGGLLVSGGTANIGGAINLSGSWTVSGGSANFTGTSSAIGESLSVVNAGANFIGVGPWAPGAVNFGGSTFAGNAPVIASGPLNWTGGIITGIISCNGGTVNNPGGINGGQLINTGVLNWIPYPYTGGGSIISNASTGTINISLNNRPITSVQYPGTASFYNAGQMNISGAGSVGNIADNFTNTGTINIQSGELQASGAVFLGSNSTLNVTVSGPTNLGTFAVSGTPTLGGTLGLVFSGYTPHTGDTYTPITYGGLTGVFNGFDIPKADWQANYGGAAFSLHVLGIVSPYFTLEALPLAIDTNGFNLLLLGPAGSNYIIQSSKDLKTWTSLTNFTTTNSSFIYEDQSWSNDVKRVYRAYIAE